MAILLKDLKKHYNVWTGRLLKWKRARLKAVNGVDLEIRDGETFALIGESGCGKTTIAKLVLNLENPTSGAIFFEGKDISRLSKKDFANYRLSIQAVFQNPYASLNPRMKIGDAIGEPIVANNLMSRENAKNRIQEMLSQVGLTAESAGLYPHEFSGGQRQRIAVARALVAKPRFIVLDEPVSALDVSIRAQIMNLLKELQKELKLGYLLISHDLTTTIHLSHRIAVIYLGRVVESLPAGEMYREALHPYTQALLKAAIPERMRAGGDQFLLRGEVPDPLNPPSGCTFYPRCANHEDRCISNAPSLKPVSEGHFVRCHLAI